MKYQTAQRRPCVPLKRLQRRCHNLIAPFRCSFAAVRADALAACPVLSTLAAEDDRLAKSLKQKGDRHLKNESRNALTSAAVESHMRVLQTRQFLIRSA